MAPNGDQGASVTSAPQGSAPTIEQRLDALEAEAGTLRAMVTRLSHFALTGDAYYDAEPAVPASVPGPVAPKE